MLELEFKTRMAGCDSVRTVGGFLGSFDPPHCGHGWIVARLLDRFEVVVVMLPSFHFEKQVRPPLNATLDQRIEMLQALRATSPDRIHLAVAHEVLYLRLAACLAATFPRAEVGLGMGDDSFRRLLDSRAYFERKAIPWAAAEDHALSRLARHVVVFGRSGALPGAVDVPASIREISSTAVRERIRALRNEGAAPCDWRSRLQGWVLPEVLEAIEQHGLYR
ncbi:MAG: adenylyltransferase/cytidyltransferase family protein [Deltaproteobacteria bacterium]|nr:adenylyltransferase/cytidyltransferase family protein [Deltaproteobacteria bacterium]